MNKAGIRRFVSAMKLLLVFLSMAVALPAFAQDDERALLLRYDKPATQWEETIPLGNGRLGMTPDGGVHKERIVLNDITLWSGSPPAFTELCPIHYTV